MDRKKFISLLGVGAAGVILSPCIGCSKDGNNNAPTNVNESLDLTLVENQSLKNIGGYRTLPSNIIVFHGVDDKYYAVQAICPHEDGALVYDSNNNIVNCTKHRDQNFSIGGVSEGQKTDTNLVTYTTSLNGNILTIS